MATYAWASGGGGHNKLIGGNMARGRPYHDAHSAETAGSSGEANSTAGFWQRALKSPQVLPLFSSCRRRNSNQRINWKIV